jgi:hypothetical protein
VTKLKPTSFGLLPMVSEENVQWRNPNPYLLFFAGQHIEIALAIVAVSETGAAEEDGYVYRRDDYVMVDGGT